MGSEFVEHVGLRQFRHSLMRRTHAFAVNNRRKLVLLFLILPCSGHADVMHKPCIKQRELTISERTSRHSFTGASHSFTHPLWIVLISLVSTDGLCVSLCTLLSDPWFWILPLNVSCGFPHNRHGLSNLDRPGQNNSVITFERETRKIMAPFYSSE